MSKYIERSKANDEIIRVLEHTDCNDKYIDDVLRAIEKLPTIVVSEDCISKGYLEQEIENQAMTVEKDKEYWRGWNNALDKVVELIENAPSVVPSRAEGEWQITDAYPHNVYCSECHKKFAQTHWNIWEDGSLPRNYCPHCGAKMKGAEE